MNDFIMCEKHNYKRTFIKSRKILGNTVKVYEQCPSCLKEKEYEKQQEEIKKLYSRLDQANIGRKYFSISFESLELVSESFATAKLRAEKYCKHFEECQRRGLGIYFYGNNGRGKTVLIACIFRELIKQGVTPYITTMDELQDNIINKQITLDAVKKKAILCVDDIGTENYIKDGDVNYKNNLLFEIVSYRDKNLLPTLFTSNHKLSDLLDSGVMKKTIERISTLATAKIEIVTKTSYRINKEKDIPF